MLDLQIEDIKFFCEGRWNSTFRAIVIGLYGDVGAIVKQMGPARGQIDAGKRDNAEREILAADDDRARQWLAFRSGIRISLYAELIAGTFPIGAKPNLAFMP